MNRMPTPGGDEGGGAHARVNVLAELPLLEARLDAPSLRITELDHSQASSFLHIGDQYQAWVFPEGPQKVPACLQRVSSHMATHG